MTSARKHLGDSHNFGRRVAMRAGKVHKPRALLWEWLVLAAESPLRKLLDAQATRDALGSDAFAFLPTLEFSHSKAGVGGEVEQVKLSPLGALSEKDRCALAVIVGRSIAHFARVAGRQVGIASEEEGFVAGPFDQPGQKGKVLDVGAPRVNACEADSKRHASSSHDTVRK
jgi:hypothetical protein